jgi:hypothetical protein
MKINVTRVLLNTVIVASVVIALTSGLKIGGL